MIRGFLQLFNYEPPYKVQAYRLRGIVHGGVRLTKVLTGVTLQPYTQVEVKVRSDCMTCEMRFEGLELSNENEITLVFSGIGWLENPIDSAMPVLKLTFTDLQEVD